MLFYWLPNDVLIVVTVYTTIFEYSLTFYLNLFDIYSKYKLFSTTFLIKL